MDIPVTFYDSKGAEIRHESLQLPLKSSVADLLQQARFRELGTNFHVAFEAASEFALKKVDDLRNYFNNPVHGFLYDASVLVLSKHGTEWKLGKIVPAEDGPVSLLHLSLNGYHQHAGMKLVCQPEIHGLEFRHGDQKIKFDLPSTQSEPNISKFPSLGELKQKVRKFRSKTTFCCCVQFLEMICLLTVKKLFYNETDPFLFPEIVGTDHTSTPLTVDWRRMERNVSEEA